MVVHDGATDRKRRAEDAENEPDEAVAIKTKRARIEVEDSDIIVL